MSNSSSKRNTAVDKSLLLNTEQVMQAIRRAVLREREACARIAERHGAADTAAVIRDRQ